MSSLIITMVLALALMLVIAYILPNAILLAKNILPIIEILKK
ncbi:hypothetical protein [Anabaena sp. PCC 7108]|nr:hypothetical protein [Anabaena sp. PCC 7108]